jgi:hypothetical protein
MEFQWDTSSMLVSNKVTSVKESKTSCLLIQRRIDSNNHDVTGFFLLTDCPRQNNLSRGHDLTSRP